MDVSKRYAYGTFRGPDVDVLARERMGNEEALGFLKPYTVELVAMETMIPMGISHRTGDF